MRNKLREKLATPTFSTRDDEGKHAYDSAYNRFTNTLVCAMSSVQFFLSRHILPRCACSLCFREGRTLPNLRIIINGEDWKKSPLSGFFEKHFYRQKGACVTSGGIFIDLSGVCCVFPSAFFVYSLKKKSCAEDLILSYTRAHNKR